MFWSPLRDEGQITHSRVEWKKSYIHAYKHIYSFWPICILKKGRGISPSVSLIAPSDAIKKEPGHDESHFINTSPPRAAYMSQWIGSALVQIMAWRRIGVKQCWVIINWTHRNILQFVSLKFVAKGPWSSLTFVPKGSGDNKQALVQIMAPRRTGDKALSELTVTQLTDAYIRH